MKKWLKILSAVLCLCISVSAFSACNQEPQSPNRFEIRETSETMIVNGESEYKIVIPFDATSYEVLASRELADFLEEATGCRLPVTDDSKLTFEEDAKYISLGETELLKSSGVVVDREYLGSYGYQLNTKGNTIFVSGSNTDYGVLFGVYKLLYHLVGFEAFTYDAYALDQKDTLHFYEFDVKDKPACGLINIRKQRTDSINALRMFSSANGDNNRESALGSGHNLTVLIYSGEYKADHPYWFAQGSEIEQLCLSNEEMMDELARVVFEYLIEPENLQLNYFLFGMADGGGYCHCPSCTVLLEKYGGKNSAIAVRFTNAMQIKINSLLEAYGDTREMTYSFLMYNEYDDPPVKEDGNGNFVPYDDTVVPAENVVIQFTPIGIDFSKKLDDPTSNTNALEYRKLRGWQAITDQIEYYGYSANFNDFFFGYNDWGGAQRLFQLLAESNAVYSTWCDTNGTTNPVFQELRTYIWTKLSWDPYCDFGELIEKFCDFYYEDASSSVIGYYNALREHYAYIESENGLPGTVYYTHTSANWSYAVVRKFEKILEQGMESISQYQESDPEKYAVLSERLNKETLLYRYIDLQWYYGYYTKQQQSDMIDAFEADCAAYGVTSYREGYSVQIRINEFRSRI